MQFTVQLGSLLLVMTGVMLTAFFSIIGYLQASNRELAKGVQTELVMGKRALIEVVQKQYVDFMLSIAVDGDFRKTLSEGQSLAGLQPVFARYMAQDNSVVNFCFVRSDGVRFNLSRSDKVGSGFGEFCTAQSEALLLRIQKTCSEVGGVHYFSDAQEEALLGPVFHQAIGIFDLYSKEDYGTLVLTFRQDTLLQAMSGYDGDYTVSSMFLIAEDGSIMVSTEAQWNGKKLSDMPDNLEDWYSLVSQPVGKYGLKLASIWSMAPFERAVARYGYICAAICLIATSLYILCSGVLLIHANRSVQSLMGGFKRIRHGELDVQLTSASHDEFSYLINEFNRMSHRLAQMQQEVERVNDEKMRALQLQHQTLLRTLQSQINLHFLANMINMISAVAIAHGDYKVPYLLKALANCMRYTFENSEKTATVRQECNWLQDYLTLQRERTGDRFSFVIDAREDVMDEPINKLLIQPFVENSIMHGFARYHFEGLLRVNIRRFRQRGLAISIRDNGQGMEEALACRVRALFKDGVRSDAVGIGLNNVVQRIRLYYPDAKLFLHTDGQGTRIDILIPSVAGDSQDEEEKE